MEKSVLGFQLFALGVHSVLSDPTARYPLVQPESYKWVQFN